MDRKFVWSPPPAALQNTTLNGLVNDLIARSFEGVSAPVVRIEDPADLTDECPSNFASLSDCFAAVIFGTVDPDSLTLVCVIADLCRDQTNDYVQNYTILGDLGLIAVDTENPSKDDVSTRFLPVQWALESVRPSHALTDLYS